LYSLCYDALRPAHMGAMFTVRPVSVEGQQNDYVRRNSLPRGGKLGIADRYRYSI